MNEKILIVLTSLWIVSGCNVVDDSPIPHYNYVLFLDIQDASGENRVKGIALEYEVFFLADSIFEIKRDIYTLDIVFPERYMDVYDDYVMMVGSPMAPPVLRLGIKNDIYYLLLSASSRRFAHSTRYKEYGDIFPPAEKLIFKVKCPYVFGNDEVHEIITWWEPDPNFKFNKYTKKNPKPNNCYRIELDKKEYNQIKYLDKMPLSGFASLATITLDNTFDN